MRKLAGIVVSLLLAVGASAQNLSDLIISEACPVNSTGIVDANGQRRSWMEITNVSTGTVNYAGCFISDDKSDLQKYMVPKGVIANRLGARQATVIWPSFEILPGKTLYLVSTDGKTVIDTIEIPEDIPADMSVRKVARDAKRIDFKTDPSPAVPTPGLINTDGSEESGSNRMGRIDPHGWTLTVTSVSVVNGTPASPSIRMALKTARTVPRPEASRRCKSCSSGGPSRLTPTMNLFRLRNVHHLVSSSVPLVWRRLQTSLPFGLKRC